MKKLSLAILAAVLIGPAAAQASVELDVQRTNMEPAPLQSSEYADIWFEVSNNGTAEPDSAAVEFVENYPFEADRDEKTRWDLGSLSPGESRLYHLEVKVDENAVQGENHLEFRTESGNIGIEHRIPVEVRSDSDLLSVSSNRSSRSIPPGKTGDLDLSMKNMADGRLKNILVSADFSDMPITAAGTSTRTVSNIGPDRAYTVSYSLEADEDAENSVYNVPLHVTYENEAGSEFERELMTGVRVGGDARLEAGFGGSESEPVPGGNSRITLRITNQGQGSSDAVSFSVRETEKYEVASRKSFYIGDMEPDDFQTAEVDIYVREDVNASEPGYISVPVEIDAGSGDSGRTVERTVEVPVYTQEELSRYGESSGSSPVVPVAVAALIAAVGIYYWRYRR